MYVFLAHVYSSKIRFRYTVSQHRFADFSAIWHRWHGFHVSRKLQIYIMNIFEHNQLWFVQIWKKIVIVNMYLILNIQFISINQSIGNGIKLGISFNCKRNFIPQIGTFILIWIIIWTGTVIFACFFIFYFCWGAISIPELSNNRKY